MTPTLVLSLFSGIGVLDEAFRELSYCVVSAGDVLWGPFYDVRRFNPPAGVFEGVIGGPPCQSFSVLANLGRAQGHEPRWGNLIPEFERIVHEAQPGWFLMEEVGGAPVPVVEGYSVHDQVLNNRWLGAEQQRERRFSFGTRDGRHLVVEVALFEAPLEYVAVKADPRPTRREARAIFPVTGRHSGRMPWQVKPPQTVTAAPSPATTGGRGRYSLAEACRLQGLPEDFLAAAPWRADAKLQAVANAVPLPLGRAVAAAVKRAMGDLEQLAEDSRQLREFGEWLDTMLGATTERHRRWPDRPSLLRSPEYEQGRRVGLAAGRVDALRLAWAVLHESTRKEAPRGVD